MLPGVAHTGNFGIAAFVTGDPEKARKVGRQHGVEHSYKYEQLEEMLRSET